jgi:hypothetical protein
MSITVRACAALCAAGFVLAFTGRGVALGQLTPVGDPVIQVFAGPTTVAQPAGGEFTFAALDGDYYLRGDAHFQLPTDPVSPQFSAFVYGFQRVTVGPLPVQITPGAAAGYKLVNGGGPVSATFPSTTVTTGFGLIEIKPSGTAPVMFVPGADHVQLGNGFTTVNEILPDGPTYVLGAGLTYDLGLQYTLRFDLTGAPSSYPSTVVTLEAGGISTWPGLAVDVAAVTVPEPGLGAATVAMLLTAAAARRRPRGRHTPRRSNAA